VTSLALGPDDLAPVIQLRDHGVSEDANRLRALLAAVQRDRTAGVTLAAPHRETTEALLDTLEEARRADWDGYGARPVSPEAVFRARVFISLLPTTLPVPDVSADPNGRVHFEWRPGPGRAFVVSVGPSDVVHYAGLFGRNKVHGSEELADEIPQAVLANLARALGKDAG
jgi:hypothetical protein